MKQLGDCILKYGKFRMSDFAASYIVTDKNIAALYGITGDNVYFLPRGEEAKSFFHAEQLCKWLLKRNVRTDSLVVALGGGSIGDTVGFVCGIFKRGVELLHVPTTLVAMVDSAIGGKTAIDLDGVKNAVGNYLFADTLIDVDFLQTLDDKQMLNGMGEIFKYRMLSDEIDRVFRDGNLNDTICACAEFKRGICIADPYCQGVRNSLNFGHTLGHAMELSLGISHGIAVANGIYYETLLSCKLGLCSCKYSDKWREEIFRQFEIFPVAEVLPLTLQDKKNIGNDVSFVLPPAFETVRIPYEQINELLLK